MITYIYFVKCPNCEDELFDFFDDAKSHAMGCLSQKPIITQTEISRNDFGECTDHCDLGTVWSWEDVVGKETDAEPETSIFTKGDFEDFEGDYDPDNDPEFDDDDFYFTNGLHEGFLDTIKFKTYEERVDFFKLCKEIGITSVQGLKDFMQEVGATPSTVMSKLYQYRYELGSDFKIEESCERKPIPEGMTIEQLVEEMEEKEDTVECTWCEELFDKSECRKEVNLGWLCSRCEAAIKSRGETLTFREGNYWDFLDESTAVQDSTMIGKYVQLVYHNSKYQEAGSPLTDFGLKRLLKTNKNCKLSSRDIDFIAKFDNRCKVIQETEDGYLVKIPYYYRDRQEHSKFEERPRYVECWVSKTNTKIINEGLSKEISTERSLEELVKDSINHLINDLGKDSSAEDFADDVIADIEKNYDIEAPEDPEKYRDWASAIACEVSRQLNNQFGEDLDPEELHDLGNTYDGGYPAVSDDVELDFEIEDDLS